jgi:hypothetical protein
VSARRRLLAAGAHATVLVVEGAKVASQARCLEALRTLWSRDSVVVVETHDVEDTVNYLKSLSRCS